MLPSPDNHILVFTTQWSAEGIEDKHKEDGSGCLFKSKKQGSVVENKDERRKDANKSIQAKKEI